jgi:hypothetical protein
LLSRRAALSGRQITAEERRELEQEFSADLDVGWLLDLMTEFPLAGTTFTLDETNPSEIAVDMKWMAPADIREEGRELYPGLDAVKNGYLPIGICLIGSGDPYFLKVGDGKNPPVVRIPHDSPEEVEAVSPSLEAFLRDAAIE